MRSEIILIGPIGVGKSTVAELLSMRTGLVHRAIDELRWKYYEEIGYDRDMARYKRATEGFWGLYRYWKPFEAHAVKRFLAEFTDCIFDFGGGHAVYEDEVLFAQVRELFAPFTHVVLLMPSPDPDESIRLLNARAQYDSQDQREVNEHFIRHHSYYDLAKHTVYTLGKDPEQVEREVYQWVLATGGLYQTEKLPRP